MKLSKDGGWKAHHLKATGNLRVERIDGQWWAVDVKRLPARTYYAKISYDGSVNTQKIIKE